MVLIGWHFPTVGYAIDGGLGHGWHWTLPGSLAPLWHVAGGQRKAMGIFCNEDPSLIQDRAKIQYFWIMRGGVWYKISVTCISCSRPFPDARLKNHEVLVYHLQGHSLMCSLEGESCGKGNNSLPWLSGWSKGILSLMLSTSVLDPDSGIGSLH